MNRKLNIFDLDKKKFLISNKKADAYKIVWYISTRLPYIAIMFAIFLVASSKFIDSGLDSSRITDMITMKRLLFSPNALAYRDPATGRVYAGMIDMDKANQENIDKALSINGTRVAARIEIKRTSDGSIRELYVNKLWYERWAPYKSFDKYDKEIYKEFVLIRSANTVENGIVRIDVISRND